MTTDRLELLERRLQHLEDQLAITQLIASYGPLVDAGRASDAAALWAETGSYHVEGWSMECRSDIEAMVLSDRHQSLIQNGSVHFHGPAWVQVDGDRATAVCESLLVLRVDGQFRIARGGASHFRLERGPQGWQVVHRETAILDGSEKARALLRHALEAPSRRGE